MRPRPVCSHLVPASPIYHEPLYGFISFLFNTPPLRLPMLDGTARYRVERIDPTPPEASGSPLDDALRAAGQGEGGCEAFVAHGAWLAHAGLPLPRMLAESALIYRFRRDTA